MTSNSSFLLALCNFFPFQEKPFATNNNRERIATAFRAGGEGKGEMKLSGRHNGSLLHHALPFQASLHFRHNRRFSSQTPQTTTEQEEQENTLGFEVESQRKFLSKLANDLSIHDVPSLSLSSSFPPVIFLYFPFIHQFC